MGMFDDALKKSVPGGNITKPLVIAAGALILAKWLGGGKEAAAPAGADGRRADEIMPPGGSGQLPSPSGAPRSGQPQPVDINNPGSTSDDGLSGGLGGLIERLRKGGLQKEADSWVGTGQNQPAEPGKLGAAIGQMTIKEIAEKAGTTEEDIVDILTQTLPELVNHLTPNGRVPTQQEVDTWGRRT